MRLDEELDDLVKRRVQRRLEESLEHLPCSLSSTYTEDDFRQTTPVASEPCGRWYVPVKNWFPSQPPEDNKDKVQPARANEMEYIAKEFKSFLEERHYRIPQALELDDSREQPQYDTVGERAMCALSTMLAQKEELNNDLCAEERISKQKYHLIHVRKLRDVLSRRGARFTDEEFCRLVAIARNEAPRHVLSETLKVDWTVFMSRSEQVYYDGARKRKKKKKRPGATSREGACGPSVCRLSPRL